MKNFIANIPVILTIPLQLLIKLLHKTCMLAIGASSVLHVLLNTETGKKLKILEQELKKAEELAKQIASKSEGKTTINPNSPPANPKLKNIIAGDKDGKKGPTFH